MGRRQRRCQVSAVDGVVLVVVGDLRVVGVSAAMTRLPAQFLVIGWRSILR